MQRRKLLSQTATTQRLIRQIYLRTARALEMGKTEGAMSGLSIVVAGLLTVVGANLFAGLL